MIQIQNTILGMPKMRLLGALLGISIHLGSVEEKRGLGSATLAHLALEGCVVLTAPYHQVKCCWLQLKENLIRLASTKRKYVISHNQKSVIREALASPYPALSSAVVSALSECWSRPHAG